MAPSTKSPAASTTPALIPQDQHAGKPSLPMGRAFTLVGSRHRAHLHLLSRSVSKSHAIIVNDNGNLYVRDTASREHVIINGRGVKEAELRDGDLIKIGSFTFRFTDGSGRSGRTPIQRPDHAAIEIHGAAMPTLFDGRTLLIGRRPTCDVILPEISVSNVHAVIFELNGRHHIRDLGSRTGTFVNGEQIHQQPLKFDDVIRVGDTEMRFSASGVESNIDELEHLVGTATLGSEQMTLARADAARAAAQAAETQALTQNYDAIPLAEPDDLLPLKEDRPHPPHPQPAPAVAAEIPADLAELDLDADPDVSGPGDTQALPADVPSETPRTPVLSSQVIDDGNILDEVGVESEERHLLVGIDLHEEKLTASGSFANIAHNDDDADESPNADFDWVPVDDEPAPIQEAGVEHDHLHAVAEKNFDTMYFGPEPVEAVPAEMEQAPSIPDVLTASTQETIEPAVAAAEHSGIDIPVVPDIIAAPQAIEEFAVDAPAEASVPVTTTEPEAFEPEPWAIEPPAAELAELPVIPDVLTASESIELSPELIAAPTLDAPDAPVEPVAHVYSVGLEGSVAEAPRDHPVESGLLPGVFTSTEAGDGGPAESSFEEPAVRYGAEPAEVAPASQGSVEPESFAFEEESSTADEEPLGTEEHHALMEEPVNGEQHPGEGYELLFGGTVPPPFPAGHAPVTASGAVGLPGWSAVRAETAKIRKPADAAPAPAQANGSPAINETREVFAATDPTPESAQHLEVHVGDTWAETYAELMPTADELSDSQFGLVVQDFAGSALGALVEHHANEGVTSHEAVAAAPLPHADESRVDDFTDHGEPQAPAGEAHVLTAHESAALEVEPQYAPHETAPPQPLDEVAVTSHEYSADAPGMEGAVDGSATSEEELLAHEGFLPEATGDELVDQALAFLNEDPAHAVQATASPEPTPASSDGGLQEWLAEAARLKAAAQEIQPATEVDATAEPGEPADMTVETLEPLETTAEALEPSDTTVEAFGTAELLSAEAHLLAEEHLLPEEESGLEFDEAMFDEASAPISLEAPEASEPTLEEPSGEMPVEDGLIFDDEIPEVSPEVSADAPQAIPAGEVEALETLPELEEAQGPEFDVAVTAAEGLTPQDTSPSAETDASAEAPIEPPAEALTGSAPVERDEPVELEFEELAEAPAIEPAPQAPLAPPVNEQPVNEQPALPPARPAAPQSMSQLLGMTRDFGSFLGGTPLSLASRPAMPPAPPPRPRPSTLFGDTEVASLFTRDAAPALKPLSLPVSTPIPSAETTPFPAAPAPREIWKVEAHPEAPQYAPAPMVPAPPPPAPQQVVAPPVPPAEEELEVLPEVDELSEAEIQPELEALPEVHPELEALPDVEPELEALTEVHPELEVLPELAELPEAELQPELEMLPEVEELPEAGLQAEPEALSLPGHDAIPEAAPEAELETLPELESLPEATSKDELDALFDSESRAEVEAPAEATSKDELDALFDSELPAEVEAPAEATSKDELDAMFGSEIPAEVDAPAEATPKDELDALFDSYLAAEVEAPPEATSQPEFDALLDDSFQPKPQADPAAHRRAEIESTPEALPQIEAEFEAARAAELHPPAELHAPLEAAAAAEAVEALPAPEADVEHFAAEIEALPAGEPEFARPAAEVEALPAVEPEFAHPAAEVKALPAVEREFEHPAAEVFAVVPAAGPKVAPKAQSPRHPEDGSRPALFDATPEALDHLPEAMEPIADVTEAVGEKPSPAAPAPSRAPEAKAPPRKNASIDKKPGEFAAGLTRHVPTPPPPARSIRRTGSRPPAAGGLTGMGGPMLPSVDVFSQNNQVGSDPFAPEIPPSGFIPPGAGAAGRRPRPAGTRPPAQRKPDEIPLLPRKQDVAPAAARKQEVAPVAPRKQEVPPVAPRKQETAPLAPPTQDEAPVVQRKRKGPRQPAVVEPIYGTEEEEGVAQLDEAPPPPPGHDDSRDLPPAPGKKKAKRWRFPFFGLLMLLIAAGASAGGVWFYMPARADLRAALRFENLDQLNGQARRDFDAAQHRIMERDDFRKQSQEIYHSAFHGREGDGFLYRDADFITFVEASHTDGDRLVFRRVASDDADGDHFRLQAVLKALYAIDLTMRDEASIRQAGLKTARKDFAGAEQKLIELRKRIDDGSKRQGEFEVARQNERAVSDAAAKLEKAWSDASAATRKARAELDGIELLRAGAQASIDSDPQIQQLTQRLNNLNDNLAAGRGAHNGSATSAGGALDAALAKYQDEIDRIKQSTLDASPLSGYLAVAQQVATTIHQVNADLAERQKASQQTVADLNHKLSEKIEAHLNRMWATDPDLMRLRQEKNVNEHRLGAAASAGMTDDAARIQAQVMAEKRAIDGRRDQIAQAAAYPDEIKSMQKLLLDQTAQLKADQDRSDQRMKEQLKLLAAAAPAPENITADQQKLLDGLVDKLVAVSAARQQLSQAAAPGGAPDVKALEAQTTELAAQIDARRKELADANKNAGPAVDSAEVVQKRAALEVLQTADASAFTEWTAAKAKLAEAQSTLDKLQSTQPDLVRDNTEYATLKLRYDELKTQIDRDANVVAVIPLDPDHEEGVQVARLGDKRLIAEAGIGGVFCLGALVLFIRSRRKAHVPFASPYDPSNADETHAMAQHPLTAA